MLARLRPWLQTGLFNCTYGGSGILCSGLTGDNDTMSLHTAAISIEGNRLSDVPAFFGQADYGIAKGPIVVRSAAEATRLGTGLRVVAVCGSLPLRGRASCPRPARLRRNNNDRRRRGTKFLVFSVIPFSHARPRVSYGAFAGIGSDGDFAR